MAHPRPLSSATDPFATGTNTPVGEGAQLAAPNAPYATSQGPFATPRESANLEGITYPAPSPSGTPVPGAQAAPLLDNAHQGSPYRDNPATPPAGYAAPAVVNEKAPAARSRRGLWIGLGVAALVIIAVAIAVPVALTSKNKNGGSGKKGSSGSRNLAASGGNGSIVTTADGSTFIYNNTFGGFWVDDPQNPWNSSARPNSWTKPLTEKWDFVNDKIYGVNLGGLFVLEPFITPHFYEKYNGSVDEFTLSTLIQNATGSLDEIENHYKTFITEIDIAQIAGAGLNWIRLPIPFWAIDEWTGEPFLAKKSWPYIVQVLKWCRKYGIRVNLDLHTIPGSQNGYNHSGKLGSINWLYGIMGLANAQRSLDYIRIIAEFISQPEYVNVVPIFSPVNEALLGNIGINSLSTFYYEMHNMVRSITGVGEGAWLAIHDGFKGTDPWKDFLPGADRFIMDTHPYLAFGGSGVMSKPFSNGSVGDAAGGNYPLNACQNWGNTIVDSQKSFGVTIAGEFSNGWNDCGLFLHGVPTPGAPDQQTYPGDCAQWTSYESWGQDTKDGLNNFALASMDALQNWFFWTWKIGPALNGTIMTPLWSYKLGLDEGWMPKDPRTANGTCEKLGWNSQRFDNSYKPYQIGGGDGVVVASAAAAFGQWPPTTLNAYPETMPWSLAPTYTQTGAMATLSVTYPGTSVTEAPRKGSASVDGWWNTADAAPRFTPVADCAYPDPYTIGTTTAVCTGTATATLGAATGTVQAIMPPPTPAKYIP